jgi:hypothetical protein
MKNIRRPRLTQRNTSLPQFHPKPPQLHFLPIHGLVYILHSKIFRNRPQRALTKEQIDVFQTNSLRLLKHEKNRGQRYNNICTS